MTRKLFNAKQPLVIIIVDSTGEEQDRLTLIDFEYNNPNGLANELDFDTILNKYTGYTYYNRFTRNMRYVSGRKKYYKVVK